MQEPFYIQWHITNHCNLGCRHCYQDDFSKKNDLDMPGLEKAAQNILDAMRQWDRSACIHLTGGEPLLKPELFPLLSHLNGKSRVEELGLITNGLYVDRDVIKRLSEVSKLRKIKISLDGADAETNDSIRRAGVFEKVLERLSLIKAERRFEVVLMFTVMKSNYKRLLSYLRFFEESDMDGLILERFIPWGRGRERMTDVLEKSQWKEVVKNLFDFFSADTDEEALFQFQAFHVRRQQGEMELLGAPCVIGTDGVCVMPEGTVFPCRRFPVSIGNLLHDSLTEIWETSKLLAALREKENLKGKCGSCGIEACRGCRSLALSLTGDYFAEDPHCGYQPDPHSLISAHCLSN